MSFTRTDRVHPDWTSALAAANNYAWQLGRRFRIRAVRHQRGWAWKVERIRGTEKRHGRPFDRFEFDRAGQVRVVPKLLP